MHREQNTYTSNCWQVSISSTSRDSPFQKTLGEAEGKVARALAGGHPQSIANAVMRIEAVKEELFNHFLTLVNAECSDLCQKGIRSLFRRIPVAEMANFRWDTLVEELRSKSPLLLKLLTTVATRVDHRSHVSKKDKFPGIVSAAAVLLKERNREMCAIPSLVSLLMYAGHCEKQVYTLQLNMHVASEYTTNNNYVGVQQVESCENLHQLQCYTEADTTIE